jgi:hypothetical protein
MTRVLDDELGKYVETTKMLAALEQIHAAIWHCQHEQFECAITLGAAAEGLLPATEELHLLKVLQASPVARTEFDYNEMINWLKHPTAPEETVIPEFEVAIVIVRAISKFFVIFDAGSPVMREFVRWAFKEGHLPVPADLAELIK